MSEDRELQQKILHDASRIYVARSDDEKSQDLCSSLDAMLRGSPYLLKELPSELVDRMQRIRPPRSCISCLLIGNHSAGKSSFINWYVGEKIQSESVAMETCGITLIRHGSKRATWRGPQAVSAFPHLEKLAAMNGVLGHLSSEFTPSSAREMKLLELIDTPGLVDGNVKYPFDVEEAVYELAANAEVILIFLDPMGKALVARCMRVIQGLKDRGHLARMKVVVGKFDSVRCANDRTTVVSQIAQQLQKNIGVNTNLLTIYLPDRVSEEVRGEIPNQLPQICDAMAAAIDSRVQDVLVTLAKDCKTILEVSQAIIKAGTVRRKVNTAVNAVRVLLGAVAGVLVACACYWVLLNVTELDPLLLCDDQVERRVEWRSASGELLAEEHHPPQTNWQCGALTVWGGVPALLLLLLLLSSLAYFWCFKASRVEQLSLRQMRRVAAIGKGVERVVGTKLAEMKKQLTSSVLC